MQIFCVREEPWHRTSAWHFIPPSTRLKVILAQRFYAVSMCKLTASNVLEQCVWDQVCSLKSSLRILYLERTNLVEQAASDVINNLRMAGHPTHTFNQVDPGLVTLKPKAVLTSYENLLQRRRRTRKLLKESGISILSLTYEGLTGGTEVSCIPEKISREICSFLGVDQLPLCTRMKKVHKKLYSEFVSNWIEVLAMVEQEVVLG